MPAKVSPHNSIPAVVTTDTQQPQALRRPRASSCLTLLLPLGLLLAVLVPLFVITVAAPDREGPDWRTFVFITLQTLVLLSPVSIMWTVSGDRERTDAGVRERIHVFTSSPVLRCH